MTRTERFEAELAALETAVEHKGMSLAGALARAFIQGINYQAEVDAETRQNAQWGREEQARIERGQG